MKPTNWIRRVILREAQPFRSEIDGFLPRSRNRSAVLRGQVKPHGNDVRERKMTLKFHSRTPRGLRLASGIFGLTAESGLIFPIALKRRRSFPLGPLLDIGHSGTTALAPARPCAQEYYWLRGAPNSRDRCCSRLPNLF